MSLADCSKARFSRRACPPFAIAGVGSYLACRQQAFLEFPELGLRDMAFITPEINRHNLLSVDLLCSERGCSFVHLGHSGLPRFIITPDGLHAVVLKIEGNVPVYRQDPEEFPVEELVLQNGIPVPQSLASKLVLAAKIACVQCRGCRTP